MFSNRPQRLRFGATFVFSLVAAGKLFATPVHVWEKAENPNRRGMIRATAKVVTDANHAPIVHCQNDDTAAVRPVGRRRLELVDVEALVENGASAKLIYFFKRPK